MLPQQLKQKDRLKSDFSRKKHEWGKYENSRITNATQWLTLNHEIIPEVVKNKSRNPVTIAQKSEHNYMGLKKFNETTKE